jgi:hypothetical protein
MPLWHGKELFTEDTKAANQTRDSFNSPTLRRSATVTSLNGFQLKHFQIMLKLLQLIHLMSDLISDWDCIVDCLEQFTNFHLQYFIKDLLPAANTNNNSTTSSNLKSEKTNKEPLYFGGDIEKIMNIIDRFKHFTRFLSAETLIKLMTSLVALSMNNMAINSTNIDGSPVVNSTPPSNSASSAAVSYGLREEVYVFDISDIKGNSKQQQQQHNQPSSSLLIPKTQALLQKDPSTVKLNYLQRGMKNGCVNFSLKSVIEISKVNAFRISSIWQMVTSHLRMMASMRVSCCCLLWSFFIDFTNFPFFQYFFSLIPVELCR